jgi:pyruvate formate lyase activating enzyme
MKEARFWKESNDKVQCELCARNCQIAQGKTGICGVRKNENNQLYSLNYGLAAPINVDPIGKKPLFHFHPQAFVLSLGTAGCNFMCDYCQNCDLSQIKIEAAPTRKVSPKKILNMAKKGNCQGVAWTYNEPTIWYEFVYDSAKFLRKKGYFNVFVTNGYMEKEPFMELAPLIDAINVDIKSFSDDFYTKISRAHLKPVLATLVRAKEAGLHVEISYLLVPPLNSSPMEIQKLAQWINNKL